MVPLDQAFRKHIKDLVADTNVGDSVYGGHEEAGELPKINFYHIATIDLPGETLSGPNGLSRVLLQVSVRALGKAEAIEILNKIMDDFKIKPNRANTRTIGGDGYFVRIQKSNITTRQYIYDYEIKCWHGICDVMLVYEED